MNHPVKEIFKISKWSLGSIKNMAFLIPIPKSLVQGFLNLCTNSEFFFFTWDLLRHSGSQESALTPGCHEVTSLPNQALPRSLQQHQSTWKSGRGPWSAHSPSWQIRGNVPSPCTSSNFTVHWVDLWEKVIKACKSSCWKENYLYKQSVIMGFREPTYRKGH